MKIKLKFSDHARANQWSINNKFKLDELYQNSSKKCEFKCDICLHLFEMKINDVVDRNRWCPYCANQKLCDLDECIMCFEKSFAFSFNSEFVTWNTTLNDLTPRQVTSGSGKSMFFDCKKCKHAFKRVVKDFKKSSTGCSYCASKILCDINCKICLDKSFASDIKSKFLKNVDPRTILKYSNVVHEFSCECGHDFTMEISKVSNGHWCQYCCNPPKLLCDNNECKQCEDKSFASNPKSLHWNYKLNKLTPRQVFKNSNDKFYFTCEICNFDFDTALHHVADNKWCPKCVNKTELKLNNWLTEYFKNVKVQKNLKFNNTYRLYDFYLPEFNLLIELDGRQHFEQVRNWTPIEETIQNDSDKDELALDNGYHLIRIYQEDVYNDRNNWQKNLTKCIDNTVGIPTPFIQWIGKPYKEKNEFFNEN